jgi:hypothetical protein
MASDVKNVKLGPCGVIWGTDDLGYTKGGVEVEISTAKKKVNVDQFGETEVDEYITGRMVRVKVPMAETDLAKLALVLPYSEIVTDGTDNTKKKIVVSSSVGKSLRDLAAKLVLHPTANAADDKNDDFVLPLASPAGDMQFAYKVDDERVYMIEFVGYVDHETGVLFVMGDEDAEA